MSEKKSSSTTVEGSIGFIFLAWVLTYFISGPPHWVQVYLFWLWVIPLVMVVLLLAVVGLVAVAVK